MMIVRNATLRMQRGAVHLHGLGERATFEFLIEIGERFNLVDEIVERLDAYGRLSPAILRAVGAERFSRMMRAVPNGR